LSFCKESREIKDTQMHQENDTHDILTVAQQNLQSISRCLFTVIGLTAQQSTTQASSSISGDVELVIQELASSIKAFDTAINDLSHASFITNHPAKDALLPLDDVREGAREKLERLEKRHADLRALWEALLEEVVEERGGGQRTDTL
jgi:hypothetical protein